MTTHFTCVSSNDNKHFRAAHTTEGAPGIHGAIPFNNGHIPRVPPLPATDALLQCARVAVVPLHRDANRTSALLRPVLHQRGRRVPRNPWPLAPRGQLQRLLRSVLPSVRQPGRRAALRPLTVRFASETHVHLQFALAARAALRRAGPPGRETLVDALRGRDWRRIPGPCAPPGRSCVEDSCDALHILCRWVQGDTITTGLFVMVMLCVQVCVCVSAYMHSDGIHCSS